MRCGAVTRRLVSLVEYAALDSDEELARPDPARLAGGGNPGSASRRGDASAVLLAAQAHAEARAEDPPASSLFASPARGAGNPYNPSNSPKVNVPSSIWAPPPALTEAITSPPRRLFQAELDPPTPRLQASPPRPAEDPADPYPLDSARGAPPPQERAPLQPPPQGYQRQASSYAAGAPPPEAGYYYQQPGGGGYPSPSANRRPTPPVLLQTGGTPTRQQQQRGHPHHAGMEGATPPPAADPPGFGFGHTPPSVPDDQGAPNTGGSGAPLLPAQSPSASPQDTLSPLRGGGVPGGAGGGYYDAPAGAEDGNGQWQVALTPPPHGPPSAGRLSGGGGFFGGFSLSRAASPTGVMLRTGAGYAGGTPGFPGGSHPLAAWGGAHAPPWGQSPTFSGKILEDPVDVNEFTSTDSDQPDGAQPTGPGQEPTDGEVKKALEVIARATGDPAAAELLNVYDHLSPAPSVAGSRSARLGVSPNARRRVARPAAAMGKRARRFGVSGTGGPDNNPDAPESASALHTDREGFFITPKDLKPTTVLLKEQNGTVVAKGFRGVARVWREAVSAASRHARERLTHPRMQGWASANIDTLNLGPGFELYFRNLSLWAALFLLLSFIVALSLAVNLIIQKRTSAFPNEADMFAQTSLGVHVGVPVTSKLYYGYAKNDVILALSLADILHVVIFAAACFAWEVGLGSRLARRRRQLRSCTIATYSVQVTLPPLPSNAALADEIKLHFEELYGEKSVAEVVLVNDSAAKLMPMFKKRAEARDRRRHFSALINLTRTTNGVRQRERAAAEADACARTVLGAIAGEPAQASHLAFVTFESAAVRSRCLREHTAGLRRFGLGLPQELKFRRWFPMSVRPAPDPATIRWENVGAPQGRRIAAFAASIVGALALVCATWAILNQSALSATNLPPPVIRSTTEAAGTLLCNNVWDLPSTNNNNNRIRAEIHWMQGRADSQCAPYLTSLAALWSVGETVRVLTAAH